jgi:hypothetical protein
MFRSLSPRGYERHDDRSTDFPHHGTGRRGACPDRQSGVRRIGKALLPVAAWGTYGGLSVGPYGGLNIGPYSSPFAGLYVDANRFTCTYDIPWDWAHRCPPIANPPEPPLAPAARAPSCAPQPVTVAGVTEKIRRLLWFAAEKAVVTARRPHRRV